MFAIVPLLWVRKLIGKPRVPYNRGLRVRGSPHTFYGHDYATVLPPSAAERKPFRIQPDLLYGIQIRSAGLPRLAKFFTADHSASKDDAALVPLRKFNLMAPMKSGRSEKGSNP
jgi:hypothetical protein